MEIESCKESLRNQILNAFKLALSNMRQKSAILIVDDKTTAILDSCLKIHQLNDMGIGAVLNVKFKRERVRVSPIYFISSAKESVSSVIEDYKDPNNIQYAKVAHLFICPRISEECMKLLKASNLRRHLKTFNEVYCDFQALEKRVFHFNRPSAFFDLYMNGSQIKELQNTAENLFSVCVSLQEHPYIRYTGSSPRAKSLAQIFNSYYTKRMTEMKVFRPNDKRAMLLIFDRTQDPVAPLLHEITYQAMIKDLMPSEKKYLPLNVKEDGKESTEESRFYYDDDPLWEDFSHKNLAHVLKEIQSKFREFKTKNRIANKEFSEQKDQKNLLRSVRDIPKYKMMMKSFNYHFEIKHQLVSLYKSFDLKKIAEMEQSFVTGLDDTGRNIKLKDVFAELDNVLQEQTVATDIKLRLLLTFIISQGRVNEKQLKSLIAKANLSVQSDVINNIFALEVKIGSDKHKPPFFNDMQTSAKKLCKSDVVQSRYEPLVATLLKKFEKGELSDKDFPSCGEEENKRNISGSFGARRRKKTGPRRSNKPKIIVFVIGGVCYSEIRECYTLATELKREIFIGSSHVMSPKEYISLLKGPDKKTENGIEVKEDI